MTGQRFFLFVLLALAIASTTLGCSGATSGGVAGANEVGGRPAIASLHVAKCGSCHSRPEPRTRTREHLEDALARHRKRVRLTGAEWDAMVHYLAMPAGNTARETR